MPDPYIIAGCNGAGKTTASLTILPDILHVNEFVNADAIASGISPLNPESVSFLAGRLMIQRINQLIEEQRGFAFETTLSTKSYLSFIKKAKQKDYTVTLLYFWLNSPELAKKRVAKRVQMGGHNIPVDIIERRYYRGLSNLFNDFVHLCDRWMIYNNSGDDPMPICMGTKEELNIIETTTYQNILSYVPKR